MVPAASPHNGVAEEARNPEGETEQVLQWDQPELRSRGGLPQNPAGGGPGCTASLVWSDPLPVFRLSWKWRRRSAVKITGENGKTRFRRKMICTGTVK